MVSFKEVKIRDNIVPIERIQHNTSSRLKIKNTSKPISNNFIDILESRKSRREFSHISLDVVGAIFYLSSRAKESTISDRGIKIEKRNTPSSGAMHTIDCIISDFNNDDWYIYNPYNHAFDKMIIDTNVLQKFKTECKDIFGTSNNGCLIWYVCDIDRLSCKYMNPESLALRESGALSATHGLIAESYGLAFCMLGTMGTEEARSLSDQRDLMGVGTAIIGRISSSL